MNSVRNKICNHHFFRTCDTSTIYQQAHNVTEFPKAILMFVKVGIWNTVMSWLWIVHGFYELEPIDIYIVSPTVSLLTRNHAVWNSKIVNKPAHNFLCTVFDLIKNCQILILKLFNKWVGVASTDKVYITSLFITKEAGSGNFFCILERIS